MCIGMRARVPGGAKRYAEPGSIGVHRSSFSSEVPASTEEAVAAVQQGTADIIAFIIEMGADPAVLQVAYSYDSSDMRYLSGSEMTRYRITTDHNLEGLRMTAADGARFRASCEAECAKIRDARFCQSYCSCMLGKLESRNLVDSVASESEELHSKLVSLAGLCTEQTEAANPGAP